MARGKKTGGRIAGTPNKKTKEEIDRATRILEIIEGKYLMADIENLTSSQRMQLYASLMEFKLPKLARQEHSGQVDFRIETITGMEVK